MNVKEKGMQKKMLIAIAAVAAVAIAALTLILTLGRKEETYRSIKIIELGGGVTIEREGVGVLTASSNMNLISGDAVKTDQNAYAVLQLDSDKYVMLAESGSMTVVAEGDEANSRTAIQLDAGSVLSEIQNPLSSGSSYDIVTPNATMSVRGTVFEVRKNEDGNIEVLVYDGKVEVKLDDKEPAFYEAGEYTQFTAAENPQFIIERAEIAEENLDSQFMERLEQINSQSRVLDLGTAQLASAQGETSSETASPEPVVTPAPTAAPISTVIPATPVPSATPTAKPAAVKTPAPQAEVIPSVAVTPEASPTVEYEVPDDDDPVQKPDENNHPVQEPDENNHPVQEPDENNHPVQEPDENNHPVQKPDENNHPVQKPDENNNGHGGGNYNDVDFWKTYSITDYQQSVSDGNAGAAECKVIYYLPYIVEATTYQNGSISSEMKNDSPGVYKSELVSVGSFLTAPETEPEGRVNYSGESLTLHHWCLENGDSWDFGSDTVRANTCLYPVWEDSNGALYYPVICRSDKIWWYSCNCVKEGSRIERIGGFNNWSSGFNGWERVNKNNVRWVATSDKIDGAESLRASWSN